MHIDHIKGLQGTDESVENPLSLYSLIYRWELNSNNVELRDEFGNVVQVFDHRLGDCVDKGVDDGIRDDMFEARDSETQGE